MWPLVLLSAVIENGAVRASFERHNIPLRLIAPRLMPV